MAEWKTSHQQACEATRVHRHQSEEILDLRMACLDVRATALRTFVEQITSLEAKTADRSIAALSQLPAVSDCSDLTLLRSPTPLPPGNEIRALIASQREVVARARVLRMFSQFDLAMELLQPLVDHPLKPEFGPLAAELHLEVGKIHQLRETFDSATDHLTQAVWTAEASGHLSIVVRAAEALAMMSLTHDNDSRAAVRWLRHAEAVLDRMGAPLDEKLTLLVSRSEMERHKGNYPQVARLLEATLELARQSPSVTALKRLGLLTTMASNEAAQGLLDSADSYAAQAISLARELTGERSYEYARALVVQAYVDDDRGRYREEIERSIAARDIFEKLLGPDNLNSSITWNNEGNAWVKLGNFAQAERACRRQRKSDSE